MPRLPWLADTATYTTVPGDVTIVWRYPPTYGGPSSAGVREPRDPHPPAPPTATALPVPR